jgi:nucleotidyltransferase/DNA polymerase involved in DNA repair
MDVPNRSRRSLGLRRRINARLATMGIHTVLELRNASPTAIRAQFGVVMERTCEELRGVSCLELEEVAPPKQQIMSSRSFGKPVECIEELRKAVATYVGRAAEKLRLQGSVSGQCMCSSKQTRSRKSSGMIDEAYKNAILTAQASWRYRQGITSVKSEPSRMRWLWTGGRRDSMKIRPGRWLKGWRIWLLCGPLCEQRVEQTVQ